MENPIRKALGPVTIKSADQGKVEALFSTFNVLDHDKDVVLPGAFKDGAAVRMSAYNHGSWGGSLPIGKGVIRTTDDGAIFEGEFFMGTTAGRDTFETIKQMGDLQEWSYSLDNVTAEMGVWEGEAARIIKAVDVHEVSPVLKGASIGTRTVGTKSESMTFQEHIDAVLADVVKLNSRAHEVLALRAEKGKRLGAASLEQIEQLAGQIKALDELLSADPPEAAELAEEFQREYLRFLSLTN
jgi:HK97 family phage prohead protease